MIITFFLIIFYTQSLWAYQSTLNEYALPLKWAKNSTTINPISAAEGLSSIELGSALNFSVNQWNNVEVFQINQNTSSANSIKFDQDFSYGNGIIAVTEVSYGANGLINKAQIIVNDRDFDFTSNPAITSKIYLPNLLTHELGHFLGLSHSEVLDSSMFYKSFAGQETLAQDDIAGLRSKYNRAAFGRIYGYVKGGNQVGVLGTHVQAVSNKTGEIISTVSDENGFFEINGLNLNDNYFLFTSPLKNLNSLPSYFSNAQDNFCPGVYKGGFFSACGTDNDGIAQSINLNSSNPEVNAGIISINCSLKNQLSYQLEKVKTATERERVIIFDASHANDTQRAYIGYIRSDEVGIENHKLVDKFTIDLSSISPFTKVKLQLISKPFGNPLSYVLNIDGPTSITLENSSTINLSHWLDLSENNSENIFELNLSAKNISNEISSIIPSASTFASVSPWPYMIVLSFWEESLSGEYLPLNTELELSDNKSCLDGPFTVPVKKAEFSNAIGNDNQIPSDASVSCATIDPPDDGPSNSLPLTMFGLLVASFLVTFIKKTKNFLS